MSKNLAWEFCICLLFLAFGIFAALDKRPTQENAKWTILKEPFNGSRSLIYRWEGDVLRNCRGVFRRQIRQGSEVYFLPDRAFGWIPADQWEEGISQRLTISVPVHDFKSELAEGRATYHVTQVSHCNQIQYFLGITVEENYSPVIFEISK